jgi:hypothetical protein
MFGGDAWGNYMIGIIGAVHVICSARQQLVIGSLLVAEQDTGVGDDSHSGTRQQRLRQQWG